MQRHPHCDATTKFCRLIGFAGLIAVTGCAAIPAANIAGSLIQPVPSPLASGMPSTEVISALMQRLNTLIPGQPASGAAGGTAMPSIFPTATAMTTTAAK